MQNGLRHEPAPNAAVAQRSSMRYRTTSEFHAAQVSATAFRHLPDVSLLLGVELASCHFEKT